MIDVDEDSVKNKFFTRKFVPVVQGLQVLEGHGYFYEENNS